MKNHSNKGAVTTDTADKKMRGRETQESTLLPIRELRNIQRTLFSLYGNEPEPLFVNGRYLYV